MLPAQCRSEGIEYLINKGVEINQTNILGDNALHMLVLNENMAEEDKVKAAQMLIDKGIDDNRPNIRMETPLMAVLNHLQFDVASLLIDNGGYILRPPAQKETEDNSTKENTEKPTFNIALSKVDQYPLSDIDVIKS